MGTGGWREGLVEAIDLAGRFLDAHVPETPLVRSRALEASVGAPVHLKLENFQATGSFKFRGAMNRLCTLESRQRAAGVIGASTGNHGLALVEAGRRLGVGVTLILPETAAGAKVRALEAAGARLEFHGKDAIEAEYLAREEARRRGVVYVSPYNDPGVVAGQGTVASEILRRVPDVETVYVTVGGGGLISGIASYLAVHAPSVEVIGCQPARSPVMSHSVAEGRILDLDSEPTLSDGSAGGIEADSITFEVCRDRVARWILVEETAIQEAMRRVFWEERLVIEGAAGVALAALLADEAGSGPRVGVLCGGNVDMDNFYHIVGLG